MSLDEKFEAAVEKVKSLPNKLPEYEFLELYGLYKQAKYGELEIGIPNRFDSWKMKKWTAWNEKTTMSQKEAKQAYISKVDKINSVERRLFSTPH